MCVLSHRYRRSRNRVLTTCAGPERHTPCCPLPGGKKVRRGRGRERGGEGRRGGEEGERGEEREEREEREEGKAIYHFMSISRHSILGNH